MNFVVKDYVDYNILKLAKEYYESAKLIYNANSDGSLDSPFIVNATFYIELFLKSLLSEMHFGKKTKISETTTRHEWTHSKTVFDGKGHDLKNLFNQIPKKHRLGILEFFNNRSQVDDFEAFLDNHKNNFIKWRYSFEGKAGHFDRDQVHAVINTLNNYSIYFKYPNIKTYEV
jgi:hypothetical protein